MRKLALFLLPFVLLLSAFAQQPSTLELAQRQFDTHDYKDAAESYRSILAQEPDNTAALGGLVDSLEASGQWRSGLSALEHLVELTPADARRIDQLGRWRSWSGDARGLENLSQACSMDKSQPQYCTDYADVLSWHLDRSGQAIALLRSVVAASPQYVPAIEKLAELLGRRQGSREEAARLFEQGLKVDPQNAGLLVAYADMLSLDRTRRARALELYDQALRIDPANADAMTGKARLLAWTGHSDEAMVLYDRVLASNPDDIAALRGKAQILNWRGNYAEAYDLLQHARNSGSEDPEVTAELARAELGLQHYDEAQRIASGLPAQSDFDDVRGAAARATGWWVEGGVAFRRNASNLEYDRAMAALSAPLGPANRVILRYTPTRYLNSGGSDFNSNYYGAELDSRIGDRFTLQTAAAGITYPGISTEYTGGIQARYRIDPAISMRIGFDRSPVDESLISLRGVMGVGGLSGQVTSNLFNIGISARNRRHGLDGTVSYTDGLYQGYALETNRRWQLEGNFGKSIHDVPYLRVAYGFAYSQFDYDASAPVPLPTQAGDYFSPTRYLLNYAGLTVAHHFSQRLEVEATGTAGAQNAESTTQSFGDTSFAGNFSGHLLWRPTERDEMRVGYEYLNVYNAFHRHLPSVTWRHYF